MNLSRPHVTQFVPSGSRARDGWWALLCIAPALLVLGIFNLYPILYSGYLSLLKWDGFGAEKQFIGLGNYVTLLQSPAFWNSIRVTLFYMLGVTILGIAAGLAIALVLEKGMRALPFYRALFFMPVITSTVAAAVVWEYLFDPTSGYVNISLRALHLIPPNWLSDPVWALPAIILVGAWKRVGFNMVLYLAGLANIPNHLYEAASVDGATGWSRFRFITLPLLTPVTLLLVIMSIIDSFLVFDQVFVMTNGGPLSSTDVIGFFLYVQAFRYGNVGFASAIAWVMFALIFAITVLQWRFFGEVGSERI